MAHQTAHTSALPAHPTVNGAPRVSPPATLETNCSAGGEGAGWRVVLSPPPLCMRHHLLLQAPDPLAA